MICRDFWKTGSPCSGGLRPALFPKEIRVLPALIERRYSRFGEVSFRQNHYVTLLALALVLCACGAFGQASNLETNLLWRDARELAIEGKGWSDTKDFYDRLPARGNTGSAECVEPRPRFRRDVRAFCDGRNDDFRTMDLASGRAGDAAHAGHGG